MRIWMAVAVPDHPHHTQVAPILTSDRRLYTIIKFLDWQDPRLPHEVAKLDPRATVIAPHTATMWFVPCLRN